MRYEVYPGARVGRLTVVEQVTQTTSPVPKWRCKCSCGKVKLVMEHRLRLGTTLSCGCLQGREPREKGRTAEGCLKRDCRYYSPGGCVYFIVEGHTRTSLHLGEDVDINNPCREYSPGPKALEHVKPFTISPDRL